MTKNWSRFPLAEPVGEDLANFSVYELYEKCVIAGYGVLAGCEVTRTSGTAVTAESGTFAVSGVSKTFAGGSLTGISAAEASHQRYDLVYIDGSDLTLKIETGIEEEPDSSVDFLENYHPRPAEPTDTDWVILAIIRVTENGIEESNFGTLVYATNSVADMRLSPSFAVDDITLQVINGVASMKSAAGHSSSHKSGGSDSIKIDEFAAPENNTNLNVSAVAHGLCPILPNNTTTFLRGDGTYATTASDSAKISHSLSTASSDFLVGNTGGGTFVKKTLAETKTVLGLGSAAYTASGDYAVAAKGVTGGDAHAPATMSLAASSRVVGRKSSGSGAAEECTLSDFLDFVGSAARGDILTRGATTWGRLAKGVSGYFLKAGANDPEWAALAPADSQFAVTARLLARKTAGAGAGEECTLSDILDFVGSAEWGDLLFRGTSGWVRLAHGTAGQILATGGHGADLAWGTPLTYVRNHAWNSSFEFFLGTAACLGWSKRHGDVTVAQDTGIRDGYGGAYAIKITSAGETKEGVSQTLKSLKASTVYTIRVWMKATTGDTARLWILNVTNVTSTSTTGEWKTLSFTTDATPTDVQILLGSDTSGDIVWFDCISITEGAEIPSVYRKDAEWDAPKQIPFGKGGGEAVVATGAISGFKQAQDNYEIVGWILTSDVSATITMDVWKKTSYPPANGDSLGTTKATIGAGTSAALVPDWSVREITKGDWLGAEVEANDNSKAIDFFLLVRRR